MTKQQEKEVVKAYNQYWASYLSGDITAMAAFLHDDFHVIGSTLHEVFTNKQSAATYYQATAGQISNKVAFRNKKTALQPIDGNIMVIEQADVYLLIGEEWTFYGHSRISTLFTNTKDGWKIIHQHGSLPDSKAEEGEQVAPEKINEENLQLKEAIKRRTVELENRNRELEIEAALERVRTVAMGMHKPDDLMAICKVVYAELQALGFSELRNTMIDTFVDEENYLIDYDYSEFTGGAISKIPYSGNPVIEQYIKDIRKPGEAFSEVTVKGEQLEAWKKFRRDNGEVEDSRLNNLEALYYYKYSIGPGGIGISTYSRLSAEKLNILHRFRNVFNHSFQRYTDIAKAQEQARESQIQLAMERVRARTMAMQKSDELPETSRLLFQQFSELGETADQVSIGIVNEAAGIYEISATVYGNQLMTHNARLDDPFAISKIYKAWKTKQKVLTIELTGEALKNYNIQRNVMVGKKIYNEEITPEDRWIIGAAFFSNGALVFSSAMEVTKERMQLLERFANVFEQTYTRFLDLQKAETQSREAQIELGLERVRAKAMAMRKSDELAALVETVFKELTKINFLFDRCIIMIYDEETHDSTWWLANPEPESVPIGIHIKYHEHAPYQAYLQAWKNREIQWRYLLEGNEKKDWDAFIFTETDLSFLPPPIIKGMRTVESVYLNASFNNFGSLTVSTLEPLTDDNFAILLRFAKVFDLTYTRFNDLQNAEAQVREAKIEAALEKIRGRSLAMHHSNELKSVIAIMFEKLNELEVLLGTVSIWLFDKKTMSSTFWVGNDLHDEPPMVRLPYDKKMMEEDTNLKDSWEAWLNGESYINKEYSFEQKNKYFRYVFANNDLTAIPAQVREAILAAPKHIACLLIEKNSTLFFDSWQGQLYSEASINVLKRVAKVFEQAYVRFLDLQKAETQAREAQIEAALERVRSRSMAMHKSDELADLSFELVKQVHSLGINTWFCAFNIYDEDQQNSLEWGSNAEGTYQSYRTPREGFFLRYYEAGQKGETLLINPIDKSECATHYDYLCSLPGIGDQLRQIKASGIPFPESQVDNVAFFKYGYVLFVTFEPVVEAHDIFKRFAKVFEQSYTRFLDLQKAEAQAREAKIETSLERVRSRTMAMHNSEELLDTSLLFFQQLKELGEPGVQASIAIVNEEAGFVELSSTIHGSHLPQTLNVPINDPFVMAKGVAAWKAKRKSLTLAFEGEELKSYNERRNSFLKTKVKFPEDKWVVNLSFFSKGWLSFSCDKNVSDETIAVLKRFAAVFEQTYTRFLDLQKAEAQAKEAQIESALERVRSRAMAMQNSDDVSAATAVMFQELYKMGIETMRCGILIIHQNKTMEVWNSYADKEGEVRKVAGLLDMNIHPLLQRAFEVWKNKEENMQYRLEGEDMKNYYAAIAQSATYQMPEYKEPLDTHYCNLYLFEEGSMYTFTRLPHNAETQTVMKKFTAVFSLTFRRYQDLKIAEAQTQEAQIQLALERVRARTMAMQRSAELAETCELLFEEFRKLYMVGMNEDGSIDRTMIGVINEPNHTFDFWITGLDGKQQSHLFQSSFDEQINIAHLYKAWKEGRSSLVVDMQGEELNRWLDYLQRIELPINLDLYNKRRVNTYAIFSKGVLGISSSLPLPAGSVELLQRFAETFNLTYTRFIDLKEAEARAQLAVREASLDRVRAEIASMRTAEDLQRITPLVWRELTALGVPFFRCGVFIVDDEKQKIHFYLSAPDGKPLAALELGIDNPGITQNATRHWREQKVYISHWSKEEFLQFAQNLISQGQIQNVYTYQGGEEAPESLTLQFVPFTQGMMYVGSAEALSQTQIALVKSLADAFSTAYARYEDFNKLEAAKLQVESTLKDLRDTQTQLIQSEKMASLGELTAGIAHEIQNPLNFVNNFSEVSTELVDEMNEEMRKGNLEDARQIAADLKDNLSKINHHGKRAGDIVKGMLQHSRSSNGVKEPTDINALTDEYLRLAYHGLRAKDKSFNAIMVTDFDGSVGMVDVTPQDIGRVVLNLITNAFYAVDEKKKQTGEGFEPTVSVSTKKVGDQVFISVNDNGNGIPAKVLNKIFQPFFTTKPTGLGTGLGLSLSYDIVKAHGGELKVETKENDGTLFTIILPIANI